MSGHVENFDNGIFSHTINVINVKLCVMVLHIELYLFITLSMALTSSQGHSSVKKFSLKILCSIWLGWNYVGALSTSSRSWIYHYFLLSHIFKGDKWHISWFDKHFIVDFFTDTVQVRLFKLLHDYNLLGVYQFIPDMMTLTLFQRHWWSESWMADCF